MGTFAARLPLYLPFSLLNFLLRVTGHFTQICPAFLHSAKFFRVEVWRADEESRVTTQNPLLKRSRFPPPSLLTFCLRGREENQHVGRTSEILEVRKPGIGQKKAWRPSSKVQQPFFLSSLHSCKNCGFSLSLLYSPLPTNLTVGRAPRRTSSISRCSGGRTQTGSGAKTKICLFCGRN